MGLGTVGGAKPTNIIVDEDMEKSFLAESSEHILKYYYYGRYTTLPIRRFAT